MDQDILNNLEPEKIEVCGICGSPDIEVRMWVNVNTNEVKSSCDDNETFCNGCEEIIRLADLTTMAKFDEANGSIGSLLFPEQPDKEKLAETPLDKTVLGAILKKHDETKK